MVLLPDDLDQHTLSAAIKLTAKNSLPGAKAQTTIGDRNHHFAAHDAQLTSICGALWMCVSVVPSFRSRQASPVRLCNRHPCRHWLMGAWGARAVRCTPLPATFRNPGASHIRHRNPEKHCCPTSARLPVTLRTRGYAATAQ